MKSHPSVHISQVKLEQALVRYCLLKPFFEEGVPLAHLARHHELPIRTVRRWVQQYRSQGLPGLARKTRVDQGQHKVGNPEVRSLIEELNLQTPRPTIAHIHRKITSISLQRGWKPPSYSYVYSIVREILSTEQ